MSCRRNTAVLLLLAAYITSVTAVGLYDPRLLGDAGPAQGLDSLDGAIWSVGVRVKQEYVDVPATVPGFAPVSHAFSRMANMHTFKNIIPSQRDSSSHDPEAVNHLDASSLPHEPWRRSLLSDPSFPTGCSKFFDPSHSEEDVDKTSRNNSFPLSVHCSNASLTEISPILLPPTAINL